MRHSLINLLATWVLLLIAVHAFAQEPDSARNVSYINRMITIGETYQNAGNLDKARHFY